MSVHEESKEKKKIKRGSAKLSAEHKQGLLPPITGAVLYTQLAGGKTLNASLKYTCCLCPPVSRHINET